MEFLEVDKKAYRFVSKTSSNELKDTHGLKISCFLQKNVSLVLFGSPYSPHSARDQDSFAYDLFCKESSEDAVRFMSNVTVFGAQGHNFRV